MVVVPSMISQAFLTLQTQAAPSIGLIKKLSKENMLNYRVSEDDPTPYIDNPSFHIHISSLVLPS